MAGSRDVRCPFCKRRIPRSAEVCPHCDEELFEDEDSEGDDASMEQGLRWLVPVGRSGWSIAAGYLGLLSCLPLVGLPLGIMAITAGWMGLRQSRSNPRLGGRGRAILGIVLGSLSVVIYSIAAVALITEQLGKKK